MRTVRTEGGIRMTATVGIAAGAYVVGLLAYMGLMSRVPRDDSDLEDQEKFMKEYMEKHPDRKFRKRKNGGKNV